MRAMPHTNMPTRRLAKETNSSARKQNNNKQTNGVKFPRKLGKCNFNVFHTHTYTHTNTHALSFDDKYDLILPQIMHTNNTAMQWNSCTLSNFENNYYYILKIKKMLKSIF